MLPEAPRARAPARLVGKAKSRLTCQPAGVQRSAFFAMRLRSRGIILRRGEWLFEGNYEPGMKFGEKYELLESLTTGAVETFVANDKVRGERVLVHILHGDPQKPNQPTVQWVLDSFRRVAPEPVGLVLETGRYSGTLYAYLVTKLPEETALRAWVKQYKAQARDTQEIPMPPAPPTPESKAATAEVAVKDLQGPVPVTPVSVSPVSVAPVPVVPVPVAPAFVAPVFVPAASVPPASASPVSVTQLLRDFDPPAQSAAPNPPAREADPYSVPVPSRPLPPISSAGEQSGLHSAPPWAPESARTPAPPRTDPNTSSPAASFRPDSAARNFPSPVTAPPPKEGPKLGEFTSFFQGPFRGDVPSETPAVSPRQEAAPKPVGDFTSMFGSVKPQKEEPPPAAGIAGNEPAGSFTGWFTPEISPRMSSTTSPPGLPRANANPAPGLSAPPLPASGLHSPDPAESSLQSATFPAAPKDPFPAPKLAPYAAPAPPIFQMPVPVPSSPPVPRPPVVTPPALGPDGATGAFSRPVFESAPPPQEIPSGPSSYTRIISARPANPADDASAEGPARAAGPPAFAMPALSVPAMAPPPLPPPPVAPKPAFAAPAAPKMPAAPKLPAAPKAPKVEAAAPPPVSYWPLILILTVLFFAAALLVLYFVLKH